MELHTYFDPARERHEKDSMVEQNQWVFKLGNYTVSVLAHKNRNGQWLTNSTDQEPYELAECVSRDITLDEVEVVKISLRALEMKKYLNCISKL